MEKVEMICINCPMGCPLTVTIDDNKEILVSGNGCKLGIGYAKKEVTDPRRIVTTTVAVKDGAAKRLSVKTKEDVPKKKIFDCIKALKDVEVKPPIHIGDVILKNVADTGIDIVATKDLL